MLASTVGLGGNRDCTRFMRFFGIFSTSVFWSVLADLFSSDQGRRLFGLIASGGTIGAILGSLVTSQIAERIEVAWLMLFPALLLEAGLLFSTLLERHAQIWSVGNEKNEADLVSDEECSDLRRGGVFSGVMHVFKSSYLLRLCAFLMFVQAFGTLLYTEQAEIVNQGIDSEESRIQFFAYIDLGSQSITLLLQVLISGWVMRRVGMAFALTLLPAIYLLSYSLYSKTEYLNCDSLVIKIKKPLVGFDRGYVREKNKWTKVENVKFLEKKYVLYSLKTNQKKML